jgi:UDP-glucose 4-epimerase
MVNALVTGGAGFIGGHLVDYLIDKGDHVMVLDDLSGGLIDNVSKDAHFVQGSILDNELVDKLVSEKEIIYHLAAYAAEGLSPFIRKFNYTNNLIGSVNLINSSIKHDIKHFVFTSSMAVYGSQKPPFDENDIPRPEDPYGNAKAAVENDLKIAGEMHGLDFTIFRPHNVYGERQFLGDPYRNVIGIFMNRIMQGKSPLIYGDGKQTRSFSYISDLIPCIAESPFSEGARNEIFNIGSRPEDAITIKELSDKVIEVMSSDLSPEYVEERKEVKHAFSYNKKAEEILGYTHTVSFDDGLERMARWAKSVGPMEPIVWNNMEIEKNLPKFWKNLNDEYPDAKKRIDPALAMK